MTFTAVLPLPAGDDLHRCGRTKRNIVEALRRRRGRMSRLIRSPAAEKNGVEHARADLFEGG